MWALTLFGCSSSKLFDIIPTWYEYLPTSPGTCSPALQHLTDIWLVVAAIIDILLRLASLAAIVFIIYGGVLYVTSQGSPDTTSKAKSTIVDALIGLVLALVASLVVSFIAEQF